MNSIDKATLEAIRINLSYVDSRRSFWLLSVSPDAFSRMQANNALLLAKYIRTRNISDYLAFNADSYSF